MVEDWQHSIGVEIGRHVVYVDKEGKREAVYDRQNNGILVTDATNMGTYNYCGSSINWVTHYLLDMATYNKWGNVEGHEFMTDPRNIDDFNRNQEARDAYEKIKQQMKTK